MQSEVTSPQEHRLTFTTAVLDEPTVEELLGGLALEPCENGFPANILPHVIGMCLDLLYQSGFDRASAIAKAVLFADRINQSRLETQSLLASVDTSNPQ